MKDKSSIENRKELYFQKNLQIIFSVTLIAVLGVSSITPAFPSIEKALHISAQDVGLLITVFTLPGVLLTPVLGVLADRLGRKKILIPSLILFGIAGTACAFARNFDLLLSLRFIQGVGAASLGSLNVTLVGDLYSGKQRSSAMGYNASVLSVGTAVYPAIGGALALAGWYFPFFLPVLAIPVGLIVLIYLKNPEPKTKQNLKEYLSAAWKGIKRVEVIGLFIASVFTFVILYGTYLTFFPFLLDSSFNSSSLIIGILMSTMSLSTALTSSQLGKLTRMYNEKSLLKISFILYAISLLVIPFISIEWLLVFPLILFGIAQGLNIPGIQILLADLASLEYRAVFMSLNGMVLRLGQTIGPLLMGLIFSIWDIRGVYFSGAVLAVTMFILIYLMIDRKT